MAAAGSQVEGAGRRLGSAYETDGLEDILKSLDMEIASRISELIPGSSIPVSMRYGTNPAKLYAILVSSKNYDVPFITRLISTWDIETIETIPGIITEKLEEKKSLNKHNVENILFATLPLYNIPLLLSLVYVISEFKFSAALFTSLVETTLKRTMINSTENVNLLSISALSSNNIEAMTLIFNFIEQFNADSKAVVLDLIRENTYYTKSIAMKNLLSNNEIQITSVNIDFYADLVEIIGSSDNIEPEYIYFVISNANDVLLTYFNEEFDYTYLVNANQAIVRAFFRGLRDRFPDEELTFPHYTVAMILSERTDKAFEFVRILKEYHIDFNIGMLFLILTERGDFDLIEFIETILTPEEIEAFG